MKQVFKYDVSETSIFSIQLPEGAKFLSVQLQHGNPQMWFEVDADKDLVERRFQIFGTGWLIEPNFTYLGTYLSHGQNFVWHLYEEQSK